MALADKKHQLKEAKWEAIWEDEKCKATNEEREILLKEGKARAEENKVRANMSTEENRVMMRDLGWTHSEQCFGICKEWRSCNKERKSLVVLWLVLVLRRVVVMVLRWVVVIVVLVVVVPCPMVVKMLPEMVLATWFCLI
jgi:hypothetical protein